VALHELTFLAMLTQSDFLPCNRHPHVTSFKGLLVAQDGINIPHFPEPYMSLENASNFKFVGLQKYADYDTWAKQCQLH
jgi:hypothetical protein